MYIFWSLILQPFSLVNLLSLKTPLGLVRVFECSSKILNNTSLTNNAPIGSINANKLRAVISELGYSEKPRQLDNSGYDILEDTYLKTDVELIFL